MRQSKHDCVSRNMTLQVDLRHDRPIITWASDWNAVEVKAVNRVVPCPDCGGLRYAGPGPHAPRWLDGRRVDCRGREVRP